MAMSDPAPNTYLPASTDSQAPFNQYPWITHHLQQPNTTIRIPGCREFKPSTGEDSLFAEILKTSRTIPHCVCFYSEPKDKRNDVQEVHVGMILGDGMNGHPSIIHGGIVATMLDESMGIYLSVNVERATERRGQGGLIPGQIVTSFTAELKVQYKKPVQAPGAVLVSVKRVKRDGRKEWLRAELKQEVEGEVVVCAVGESLFVEPRKRETKI